MRPRFHHARDGQGLLAYRSLGEAVAQIAPKLQACKKTGEGTFLGRISGGASEYHPCRFRRTQIKGCRKLEAAASRLNAAGWKPRNCVYTDGSPTFATTLAREALAFVAQMTQGVCAVSISAPFLFTPSRVSSN